MNPSKELKTSTDSQKHGVIIFEHGIPKKLLWARKKLVDVDQSRRADVAVVDGVRLGFD